MDVVRVFQKRHCVPIYVAEIGLVRWGEGSEQYITDLVHLFDEFGWSWSYFCIGCWHGWDRDYNGVYASQFVLSRSQYIGVQSARWTALTNLLNETIEVMYD